MKEKLIPQGTVKIYRGAVSEENLVIAENLVVNSGLAVAAQRLITNSAIPTHIGVGTGNTAPAAGQTALVTPLGSRAAVVADLYSADFAGLCSADSFADLWPAESVCGLPAAVFSNPRFFSSVLLLFSVRKGAWSDFLKGLRWIQRNAWLRNRVFPRIS